MTTEETAAYEELAPENPALNEADAPEGEGQTSGASGAPVFPLICGHCGYHNYIETEKCARCSMSYDDVAAQKKNQADAEAEAKEARQKLRDAGGKAATAGDKTATADDAAAKAD